jgi:predicted HAD superfamily hydrolase
MREQEHKRAKKIVEVNTKILKALREEYIRLMAECSDPKTEEAYDEVLDALQWNYLQSADWLCKLERSNRVGVLEE